MNEDYEILESLKDLKLRGVRYLYSKYGEGMVIVAFHMLGDTDKAKELVYDTFWKLWRENKFTDVTPPLRPFLYKEIQRASLKTISPC